MNPGRVLVNVEWIQGKRNPVRAYKYKIQISERIVTNLLTNLKLNL
jgi:hypothetical protein